MSVQEYLRVVAGRGRERRTVAGFELFLNPALDRPHSNYAIPQDGVSPSADDVADLLDAFVDAARLPRLEYLPATAPAAEDALLAGGFQVELRTPVMTCTAQTLRAAPPDGAVVEVIGADTPAADVIALKHVQQVAFGEEPDPGATADPGVPFAVLARVDGAVAGGGMALEVARGTTEIVGIAVAEPYRRRGIAGAVTAELARLAFEAGAATAFLTPGHDEAQRIYARAGFAPTDVMLHLRRPA